MLLHVLAGRSKVFHSLLTVLGGISSGFTTVLSQCFWMFQVALSVIKQFYASVCFLYVLGGCLL